MSATYIHTKRNTSFTKIVLRILAVLYFLVLAAAIVYLWIFTQDRYVTSGEFRISRQDASGVEAGLVSLALPGLTDSGSQDSQIAIGYIESADLLMELEKEHDLIAHYSSPAKDFVFRMAKDATLEDRLEYYRSHITGHFASDSGMTVIAVDSFDPKLSQKVAASLLVKAEAFINQINREIADQQLTFVRNEVNRTASHVEEINEELITLQNKYNFINPDSVISSSLQAVQEMKMENLRAEAELTTIMRDSPDSPRIEALRSRIRSLNEVIDTETAKLSGPEKDRLNQLLVRFKQLELKLDFATRLRTGAEMMLEKNRVEAVATSRFFTIIQRPYLPEDVGVPRRGYATATMIVLGIMIFLIVRALTHSIFERV